jgi:hypothetical protein
MNSGVEIKGMTSNAQLGYVFHDIPLRFASGIPRISTISSACGGIIQPANITVLRL